MSKGYNQRLNQLSQQRELIEQKKQEILKKMADKSQPSYQSSPIPAPPTPKPVSITSARANSFKNDGSFIEQFRRLQQQKAEEEKKKVKESAEKTEKNKDASYFSKLKGISIKLTPSEINTTHLPLNQAAKKLLDDDEESDIVKKDTKEISPPDDINVRLAVEKVAISVAINGLTSEEAAKSDNPNNPNYSFLSKPESPEYKYFLKRVEELKEAKTRAENQGILKPLTPSDTGSDNSNDGQPTESKRRKRSRWDPSPPVTPLPAPMPAVVPNDISLRNYALQVYGHINLTQEQWKQLEDQRKMRAIFEMMQAKKKEQEMRDISGKVKYEYDSDEDTEGGTWEHKKRAMEMEKTKIWAKGLTEKAAGKHHIGDFLPPDELDKFMERWDALREGRNADISDYKESRIASDNKGYQMLQKMGWTEGQGLGADNSGIIAPINGNPGAADKGGLGQSRPGQVSAEDDEYEVYRKRMMLAYRFRPNPLNNPRRAYY